MIIWGITALGHDASITVLNKGQILFAAHSERYSRIKNDENLNNEIVEEALRFGHPDKIVSVSYTHLTLPTILLV